MESTKTIVVKLKPSAERYVKKKHPWIFDQSIAKQSHVADSGNPVVVFDKTKNKFLALGLYDPHSPIRVKLVSWVPKTVLDIDWFTQQIGEAHAKRSDLLSAQTNSCRVIYGENDGLPGLICDRYADVLVLKIYSTIWIPYLYAIVEGLAEVVKPKTIVLRQSRSVSKLSDLVEGSVLLGELATPVIQFVEHGVIFETDVVKGHKTGFFLDHRANRYAIQQLAKGKTVLDVFAYSGGFSVHALVGGAKEVTSVDISQQALNLAKRNAQLNAVEGRHVTLCGDAFEVLESLARRGKQFDIVVIDPPSFAKQLSEVDKAVVGYRRLAQLGLKLVADGGLLVLASCSSRVTADQFFKLNEEELPMHQFDLIETTYHDIDHPVKIPEMSYLKCGYYRKLR